MTVVRKILNEKWLLIGNLQLGILVASAYLTFALSYTQSFPYKINIPSRLSTFCPLPTKTKCGADEGCIRPPEWIFKTEMLQFFSWDHFLYRRRKETSEHFSFKDSYFFFFFHFLVIFCNQQKKMLNVEKLYGELWRT